MAYEIGSIEYPSVTQILGLLDKSGALCYWSARCATEYIAEHKDNLFKDAHSFEQVLRDAITAYKTISKDACDTGSQVHSMIERYIKTERDQTSENDAVQNGFLAFLEWEERNRVKWIQSELTLVSTTYGYAGTCDAIADINGYRYLVDFKTSKAIYDEYRKQLAAYRIAEESGLDVAVLRLDKETGEPEFKDLSKNIEQHERSFLKLVDFFYSDKKRRLKNNPFVEYYHGAQRKKVSE